MITYHHIGGRNGTYPLPLKTGPLLQDIHLVLYDADENCMAQMDQSCQGKFGKESVFPFCIGGKSERRSFNVNYHPTTSSLYDFNEAFSDYQFVGNPLYGEYRFGDACQRIKKVMVDLLTLQACMDKTGIQQLDFLSLDIQGAEYEVLESAQDILQKQCVGIQLEVEFVELYKNQKTFSDIHSLLQALGFSLIEIATPEGWSPISLPIGFRANEQPLYTDLVYVKHLSHLSGEKDSYYKMAFFSLLHKNVGICLQALQVLATLDDLTTFVVGEPIYVRLLKEFWACYQKQGHCRLPKISELFSSEMFQAFYQKGHIEQSRVAIKDREEKYRTVSEKYFQQQAHAVATLNVVETDVEKLLSQYHLLEVKKIIQEKRRRDEQCFKMLKDMFAVTV